MRSASGFVKTSRPLKEDPGPMEMDSVGEVEPCLESTPYDVNFSSCVWGYQKKHS